METQQSADQVWIKQQYDKNIGTIWPTPVLDMTNNRSSTGKKSSRNSWPKAWMFAGRAGHISVPRCHPGLVGSTPSNFGHLANVLFDTEPIFFLNIFIYNINCLSYYLSLNSFHVLTSIDLNWFTDRFIYWPIHLFEYIFSCLCVDSLIHLSIEFFTIPYAHICMYIYIHGPVSCTTSEAIHFSTDHDWPQPKRLPICSGSPFCPSCQCRCGGSLSKPCLGHFGAQKSSIPTWQVRFSI